MVIYNRINSSIDSQPPADSQSLKTLVETVVVDTMNFLEGIMGDVDLPG